MSTNTASRFVNFPVAMLADTITEPKRGMDAISSLAFCDLAPHCARKAEMALIQAVYASTRHDHRARLPAAVASILRQPAVVEFTESAADCWAPGGETFEETALEVLTYCGIELSEGDRKALVLWCGMRDAADLLLGRTILDFDAITKSAKGSRAANARHVATHGTDAVASVPAAFFFEVRKQADDPEAMRLLRMVAAVRSVLGRKAYVGTTKRMLAARCVGGKSPRVADAIASHNPAVRAELDALGSRYRMDRLLMDGACRGFFEKLPKGRCIYFSTKADNPGAIASAVRTTKTAAREAYRTRQRTALAGTGTASTTRSMPSSNPSSNPSSMPSSYKQVPLRKSLSGSPSQ